MVENSHDESRPQISTRNLPLGVLEEGEDRDCLRRVRSCLRAETYLDSQLGHHCLGCPRKPSHQFKHKEAS